MSRWTSDWRLTPVQRLSLASGGLLVAAAGLWAGDVRLLPQYAQPGLPWWVLTLLFVACDRWPLRLNARRRSPSLALAAAPLIIGLYFVPPLQLLGAYALSVLLTVASRRWRSLSQGVFAVTQFVVLAGAGEIVFHVLAPVWSGTVDWLSWLAAGIAATILVLGNTAAMLVFDHLEDRLRRRAVMSELAYACGGAAASACFGLLAVELVRTDTTALVLLAGLALILLAAYRQYVQEHQERVALEFLHGAGDALGSRELESAIVQLLSRARTMFNAEIAQLTIFPSSPGEKAFRTTVRAGQRDLVMEPLELSQLDDVLEAERDGVIVDRHHSPPATAEMLARRGINEAMVALLRGETRILGALLVGGHLTRAFDARDLQLFGTLAIQTSTTLENGRLERSIARLTELQEQLAHQAFHDSLTDLANRTLLTDRIEHALTRTARTGRAIALLFIDVDDFKAVNDTLGHAAGDALLVGIADRLRSSLRRPDTAARLGGDEFAVLLEDVNEPAEAEIVARRIYENLRVPFELHDQSVTTRVSIGVAVSTGSDDTASTLMRHADVAMYAAKGSGKNQYVVFAPGMETAIVSRHRLRSDLEIALAEQQLVVHYQPVVDLVRGDIVALEALVRWRHPQRGLVPPSEFVPMAEESGLILPLGDHVLRSACTTVRHLRETHARAHTLYVTVNISARQLQQPLFVEDVLTALQETGLAPEAVVLELTESMLLEEASNVGKLESLRRAGIRIAIDDFGTGYSSLSYLRRLPVDIIKIAKPFVDDLRSGGGDFARAIIGLGDALRVDLVAEGIETAEQLVRLRELGCRLGQGFHLSHPVAAAEVEELVGSGVIAAEGIDAEAADALVIPLRRPG